MTRHSSAVPVIATAEPGGLILQRACACGRRATHVDDQCEDCQRKEAVGLQARLVVGATGDPLEQEADRAAAQVLGHAGPSPAPVTAASAPRLGRRESAGTRGPVAPPSVAATLGTRGEALPPSARAFFEPRFGHDFSRVRVHRDAPAAASARDVAAHAYTVGHQIVFGAGQYAPASSVGRSLLAHELAHVVQQSGALHRSALAPEPATESSRPEEEEPIRPERQADEEPADAHDAGGIGVLLHRSPLDDLPEGGWPEKDEAAEIRAQVQAERECVAATPADPVECDPAGALSWADFAGAPQLRSRFGALTHSTLRGRTINTALLRCMPHSAAAAGALSRGIQALFTPARSWVKPAFANAGDPQRNGCANSVAACQQFFDREAAAGRTGGTYGMSSAPAADCPASATARGDRARSRDDCATAVATDCTDRATAESARLLQHEQTHFDLTCAMARKANAMLTTTPNFDDLLRAARTTLATEQRRYDSQSNHGCNGSSQSQWQADIAAGLPAVTITVTAAGGRGRGRGRGRRR
jgi:hypothetical protein